MITNEYRFHIYAKDKCLYSNLTKEKFTKTWETLKGMVGLMRTEYELEDLQYERVELENNADASY